MTFLFPRQASIPGWRRPGHTSGRASRLCHFPGCDGGHSDPWFPHLKTGDSHSLCAVDTGRVMSSSRHYAKPTVRYLKQVAFASSVIAVIATRGGGGSEGYYHLRIVAETAEFGQM